MHTIGVDPARQGRGIGRALLRDLLAVADGPRPVFLEVRTDNEAAIALYEAEGFSRIGVRKRYYQPSGADAYTMRRDRRERARFDRPRHRVLLRRDRGRHRPARPARRPELLADAVASSVDQHARFGGVVPEIASRAHLEAMVPTVHRALRPAGDPPADVDAVAVTCGPGLAGALLVGVAAAKAYAAAWDVPLYGVNHLAGHVAADTLEHGPLPPCLALLVSGGHTSCSTWTTWPARSPRSARPSTTPPARPTTRSPGCSACRSRAARTSTGSPATATRRRSPSRAA